MFNPVSITGAILAGGKGSRMGGIDKGLVSIFGRPLYCIIAERLQPQVSNLVINANRHLDIYHQSPYPIIPDITDDFFGPLAGMQAVLKQVKTDWVLFVPCDVPLFPLNLAEKMWAEKGNALACYASDGQHLHPIFALLHRSLYQSLTEYLNHGDRKLILFMQKIGAKCIAFSSEVGLFTNLNTLEDCFNWEKQKYNGQ